MKELIKTVLSNDSNRISISEEFMNSNQEEILTLIIGREDIEHVDEIELTKPEVQQLIGKLHFHYSRME